MALIDIDWETVRDSLTQSAPSLEDEVAARIEGGDIVNVGMPNGTQKTFDDEEEWKGWYRSLKQ